MADAGLQDFANEAKARLINEVQRGDMARGGQTVSPDLKRRSSSSGSDSTGNTSGFGDERVFAGAKVAIEQGILATPADLDPLRDLLTERQLGELAAQMSGVTTISNVPHVSGVPDSAVTFGPGPNPEPASSGPDWGGGAIPDAIGDWFRDNVEIGFGPGPTDGRAGIPGNGRTPLPPGAMDPAPPPEAGLPPDMGLPFPEFGGSPLATPDDAGLLSSPQNPIPMGEDPASTAAPEEDPIVQLAAQAGSKDEAVAIADEAEASGLFPGARSKVMKYFGWDEDGADDFGRALMGFGSGLLQGGPNLAEALGAGFQRGSEQFVQSKDERRQDAFEDRRIAMEDERLDYEREEMNDKRQQAALERLGGEAAATQSGLVYYEDKDGNIRSREAPLADGPQDEESQTDMARFAQWRQMPDSTPEDKALKDALGRKWGFVEKAKDDVIPGLGV